MAIFDDPDEHLETMYTLWGVEARIGMIGTKPFRSEFTKRVVGSLSCVRGKITPNIYHAGGLAGLTTTFVFFDEGPATIVRNGVEVRTDELFIWPLSVDYCSRADSPYGYRVIAIPDEELNKLFDEPFFGERLRPSAESLTYLRRVHDAAMAGASSQDSLMRAVSECLATAENAVKIKINNRARTILRFQRVVENNLHWPASLDYICGTVGVIERTLRRYCDDCLGRSPHDYITSYRLNKVRHALAHADPANAQIAEIAAYYGFGDHSRFARLYRGLFDEPPSVTLRSSKNDGPS